MHAASSPGPKTLFKKLEFQKGISASMIDFLIQTHLVIVKFIKFIRCHRNDSHVLNGVSESHIVDRFPLPYQISYFDLVF